MEEEKEKEEVKRVEEVKGIKEKEDLLKNERKRRYVKGMEDVVERIQSKGIT